MNYTVTWKKLPEKSVISVERYSELHDAHASADIVVMGGPGPVEITIADETGTVLATRVIDIASSH